MIKYTSISQFHLGTVCLESSSGLSAVQKLSGELYNHLPIQNQNGVTMSHNSVVALQGSNNLADAIAENALSVTGSSENVQSFSVESIAERWASDANIFGLHPVVSSPVVFAYLRFGSVVRIDDDGTETIIPCAVIMSDDSTIEIPDDCHNGTDMAILPDGTLIDTYVPKLLPSGRTAKRDSEHSEYSDWNIRRMVLTGKARKMRDAVNSLGETVDTDSQILVSFRVVSLRGIRLVNDALASGKGYVSASHFVASKFLASVPDLAMSDLSTFRDKSKKVGAVSSSQSTVAQDAAGLNKAKLLEMLAKMSDADVLALTSKLMA